MRILVTGATGRLGSVLVQRLAGEGHDVVAGTHRNPSPDAPSAPLEITDSDATRRSLERIAPQIVFHTAHAQADWATTAGGAANVAVAAAAVGARLVHVSSDAVFSGRAIHYNEEAVPDPISPYGAAKAAAELVVRTVLSDATIVRTSLILGRGESTMEHLVHALVNDQRDGALFTDDIRCPIHVDDLAAALCELPGRPGMFHLAGPDAVSRYEIGELICRRDGLDPHRLRSGSRAKSGIAGPVDVRLDSSWTRSQVSVRIRGAREFLMTL